MSDPERLCSGCRKPATLLCDFVIGVRASDPTHPITCDGPICERCAKRVARIHVLCSPRRSSGWRTIDHCPAHAKREAAAPKRLLTDAEADELIKLRDSWWSKYEVRPDQRKDA